jgi:hypothetical protein
MSKSTLTVEFNEKKIDSIFAAPFADAISAQRRQRKIAIPRKSLNGFPHMPVNTPKRALAPYLEAARLTNPQARFVGISLNTSRLSQAEAFVMMHDTEESLGMPCVDPSRTGVAPIVAALESFHAQ